MGWKLDGHKDIFICAVMLSDGHPPSPGLDAEMAVNQLRALAEPTRLRIMLLLAGAELSVKDLTRILGQSQPRISRHLKLLAEAQLIDRHREGAWVNVRLNDGGPAGELVGDVIARLNTDDPVFERDRSRMLALIDERRQAAMAYFAENAGEWDAIRSLHVDEQRVEAAMLEMLGPGPFARFLDVGTGTGRILELFAQRYRRGIGLDNNPAMLAYARSRLEAAHLAHAQARQGDLFNISARDGAFDAIVVHQVLHFLDDPKRAVAEFGRVLAPGGRLLIVDFAPHGLEDLRDAHAHRHLGLPAETVDAWMADAGLDARNPVSLPPPDDAGARGLTVTLWLAEASAAGAKHSPTLEHAA